MLTFGFANGYSVQNINQNHDPGMDARKLDVMEGQDMEDDDLTPPELKAPAP